MAEQNPETSRLIDDDPYRSQYGSNNRHPQRAAYQPDPESLRREREALEGICHSMSEYVEIAESPRASPREKKEINPNHEALAAR